MTAAEIDKKMESYQELLDKGIISQEAYDKKIADLEAQKAAKTQPKILQESK